MADRSFPAPHDGFCDLCSKPIAAGDRVCLLDWSEWAHKTCVDARPVPIPLPPEPPHDRVVEAVDQDGTVVRRLEHDGNMWRDAAGWSYLFGELVQDALDCESPLSLRHVAAESGEQA